MNRRALVVLITLLLVASCESLGLIEPSPERVTSVDQRPEEFVLEIKFVEDLEVRLAADGVPFSRANRSIGNLRATLAEAGVQKMSSLVGDDFELQIEKFRGRREMQDPDMGSWYRATLSGTVSLEHALARLRSAREVEHAYLAPQPAPLPGLVLTTLTTPNFTTQQTYFGAAPAGTEAIYARSLPGGRGAGIRVVDIETAWRYSHEDLNTAS